MKTKGPIAANVIISGAGPAGMALAALLARAGLKVALIDAEPLKPANSPEKPSGRTAALLSGSVNILKQTGIWNDLKGRITPMKAMRLIDDSHTDGKTVRVEFHAAEIGRAEFGYNIPNSILNEVLRKQIGALSGITLFRPSKLADYRIEKNSVIATLDDGREITAPLLVGCDGRNSKVREVAKIGAFTRDYGQTAMTFLINHSKPHDCTATEFHRPGGPFTFVPMGGNTASVVWAEKTEDAKTLLAMKKQDFTRILQDRSLGLLGEITMASDPQSWPLMFLRADDLAGERIALAAEAAHVMSPIGAQGLNLSLRDVAALAETIVDAARLGEDIGSGTVLKRYARRRNLDFQTRTAGIDAFNRIVANDVSFIKELRRLGLRGLEAIPALKNIATQQGLNPAMDEGRLLAGRPL
ncbi:MAG: FAD-dependent monooxygenase [Micavibrio sp.]